MAPLANVNSPCLKGFEHIHRFWDENKRQHISRINPGEYYVTQQDELITTILGSCISVCAFDPKLKIGGMNHFMLPSDTNPKFNIISQSFRYGDVAMARLINDILSLGGIKERLIFKAFGAGNVLNNTSEIGKRNIEFLHTFMKLEGIKLRNSDLGGTAPRKVLFFPNQGRVLVKRLSHYPHQNALTLESRYQESLDSMTSVEGDIDIF